MKSNKALTLIGDVMTICAELEKKLESEITNFAVLAPEDIEANAEGKEQAVKRIEEKMIQLADCWREIDAGDELRSLFSDAVARLERISELTKRSEDTLRERKSALTDRIQRLKKGARGFRGYRGTDEGDEGPTFIDLSDKDR